ncbi:DUF349 domain-containing protein [Nocardioides marmoribigeumensis]|uniref:DUF349 domain-containing protein n=1 Tax=Nocardioides marmoribigeumensis TaxID=433649 RepID=A0ABU2BQV4_9ACTN|nr:DUF349 domain-containing protein [Nocardioides marmoribigeumensis]MDR7361025.1 hypothetical protein [Nocardioides marmoribigeumensis]
MTESPETPHPAETPENPAPEAPEAPAAQAPASEAPAPAPRPGPRPVPRPGRRPAAAKAAEAAPVVPQVPESDPRPWGRVDEEGNVYCKVGDGGEERLVGQTPDMTPEAALAFFGRKYDELRFELALLEQRVTSGTAAPDDAAGALKQLKAQVRDARVVGDLAALDSVLATLDEEIKAEREKRKARRAEEVAAARTAKERLVAEAEKISGGTDWRHGADKLRTLFEEWKALPRLDKPSDDELWKRYSAARTSYTRRRKAHYAEQSEKREAAKVVKLKLVKQAEALATSTDWGPTAGAFRDLMQQWKAAGPAPRTEDEELWQRFRGAQDQFFNARDAVNKATDAEYAGNAEAKEKLLTEAEALLPVTDLQAAKTAFRDIAERWDAAGKVPRDRIKDLEGRMRKVEQAIRSVEDAQWKRSNPEARARAADTVAQLEASIADLRAKADKARAAGNEKKAGEHESAAEARTAWLDQAQKALEEFSR